MPCNHITRYNTLDGGIMRQNTYDKIVAVNMQSVKSIERAEQKKTEYENAGYALIKTEQVGVDLFVLTYRQ
jgi:hypothetical protein